ncbi:Outer membrane protein assembly factor BamB, contains PQQ-like beta-propeller repeat [Lachnospiraceae bacterium NE2001]|nr:Outer membrane protein assembly factor BamB, contains PQQ-like beta-propeller repeat [Lachnospiraceae bacterium NE2001]
MRRVGRTIIVIIFELLIISGLYLGIKKVKPDADLRGELSDKMREIFLTDSEVAEGEESAGIGITGRLSDLSSDDLGSFSESGQGEDANDAGGIENQQDTAMNSLEEAGDSNNIFYYPEIDFEPHAVSSTEPTNFLISTDVAVDETILSSKADYQSKSLGDISFDTGSKYSDQEGVFTFRGNNFRDNPVYGTSTYTWGSMVPQWSIVTGSLTFEDATWSGSGWTGQPLMRKWSRETKAHMNMYDWAKEDDELVEVIYACMNGYIYFLDMKTGEYTRDPMNVGFTFKGSGALDPRGYPLMYVGAGYDTDTESARSFIINLLDCSIIYTFGNDDPFSLRGGLSFFDSSAIVDAETDTLIYPGENGILYLIHLGTTYDEASGKLSLALDKVVRWRYSSVRTSHEKYWPGMETSAAIYKNYLFITDNGANLFCLNLNTMETVWVQDILDDSNSTPVLSIEDGKLYIYVSTSFHLGWRSSTTATVPIWKINAETGEIVWQTEYECSSLEGVSGGVQSTIAVGRSDLNDLIFVTVAMTHGTGAGDIVALNKADGSKAWENQIPYSWSSPICVYNKAGEGEVIFGASDGRMRCLYGLTGEEKSHLAISDGTIEASPAVYEDYMVVGTRAGKIWGIHLE